MTHQHLTHSRSVSIRAMAHRLSQSLLKMILSTAGSRQVSASVSVRSNSSVQLGRLWSTGPPFCQHGNSWGCLKVAYLIRDRGWPWERTSSSPTLKCGSLRGVNFRLGCHQYDDAQLKLMMCSWPDTIPSNLDRDLEGVVKRLKQRPVSWMRDSVAGD